LREIVNGCRTGIAWEYLPHDFPPYKTVYDYYAMWEADGTTETLHDLLRQQVRIVRGRASTPTAAIIDSQSVKTSCNVARNQSRGSTQARRSRDANGTVPPTCSGRCWSRSSPRLSRRWVVERTQGWLMQHHRLVRDDETLPQRSRAMIHWAMANTTSRVLAGESTQTWRNYPPKTDITT
jgi:transposase